MDALFKYKKHHANQSLCIRLDTRQTQDLIRYNRLLERF